MSGLRRFNIDDLSYLNHLESLNLATNLFNDLSALSSMQNLRHLDVSNNPYLTDYDPLKDFPSLKSLKMDYNYPEDFDF